MDRSLALLAIGLVFGAGLGFVIAAGSGATLGGLDHALHDQTAASPGDGHGDHGAPVAVPLGASTPTLAVTLMPDPVSGWNLHVETGNFRFAPEAAGLAHVPGDGHAHVYVDGAKIARLYGPWMHIPALPPGAHVEVTLNANDHRPLAVHGHVLSATATVPGE